MTGAALPGTVGGGCPAQLPAHPTAPSGASASLRARLVHHQGTSCRRSLMTWRTRCCCSLCPAKGQMGKSTTLVARATGRPHRRGHFEVFGPPLLRAGCAGLWMGGVRSERCWVPWVSPGGRRIHSCIASLCNSCIASLCNLSDEPAARSTDPLNEESRHHKWCSVHQAIVASPDWSHCQARWWRDKRRGLRAELCPEARWELGHRKRCLVQVKDHAL